MKRKLLILLAVTSLLCNLTGCGSATYTSVKTETGYTTLVGKCTMINIGNGLYYDSTTRIVYWWNGVLNILDTATTPSPYYAPNGLPYKYNPTTNTFEEIKNTNE